MISIRFSRARTRSACFAAVACAILIGAGPAGDAIPRSQWAPDIVDGQYVRARGGSLVVNGARLRFLGANAAVMHGDAQRAAAEATLDAVAVDRLSVVRIWAFGESPGSEAWRRAYAFRTGENEWVEESFAHLDRVLVAARARRLRVIVVLANRWGDYGGIPQYLRWAEPEVGEIDPLLEEDLTPFWRSERAYRLYEAHVARVVSRENHLTGEAYADDPTIFSWELFNEAAAAPEAHAAMLDWVRRASALIRRYDRNHAIAAGHGGFDHRSARELWTRVHRLREIEYADTHAYPQHDPDLTAFSQLAPFIDERTALGASLGKPLVWGEIGIPIGHPRLRPRSVWIDRFARRAMRGAAGLLVWFYGPPACRENSHYIDASRSTRLRRVLRRHAPRWSER